MTYQLKHQNSKKGPTCKNRYIHREKIIIQAELFVFQILTYMFTYINIYVIIYVFQLEIT